MLGYHVSVSRFQCHCCLSVWQSADSFSAYCVKFLANYNEPLGRIYWALAHAPLGLKRIILTLNVKIVLMRYLNYFENVHLKCTNFFGRKLISAEVFFCSKLASDFVSDRMEAMELELNYWQRLTPHKLPGKRIRCNFYVYEYMQMSSLCLLDVA